MEISASRHPGIRSSAHEYELVAAVQSDVPVLITSESPAKRREWARFIHTQGVRRNGPFVEFDCGMWSATETGRHSDIATDHNHARDFRRFRDAADGTLFLDGIEALDRGAQAYLFSVIEASLHDGDGTSSNAVPSPRIITGASRSVFAAVVRGTFNESLFYRLNIIHLIFPSGS
jgi:two-component system C4-dicarboxylate transport response regulator DctD